MPCLYGICVNLCNLRIKRGRRMRRPYDRRGTTEGSSNLRIDPSMLLFAVAKRSQSPSLVEGVGAVGTGGGDYLLSIWAR